ncbi:MAG: glycoside hydrolase family 88 protein, partial [Asticcacaulis sp.]|nr:glycoside hydrolase family 88 protein [Asticcacaulis sp.]
SAKREPLIRAFPKTGLDRDFFKHALTTAMNRIDSGLDRFTDAFPAPSSTKGVYGAIGNTEWTCGFWTGMLWLAWEVTGAERYRTAADRQVTSFSRRATDRIAVDHHDLGFLYSLSCVAAYRLTGSAPGREAALKAARLLLDRYLPQAGIIQAWGDLSDPEQAGRMIIDCNLNLPLLFWASVETGHPSFQAAAQSHIKAAQRYLVRPDASTFHTFHMDPETGEPRFGTTHQGFSDTSCWARGQAWGISGFPLAFRYTGDPSLLETSANLANHFLNRLPNDLICAWDLVFTEDNSQRDSSAAAIAACGLLELAQWLPQDDRDAAQYRAAALAIVGSLAESYACTAADPGTGLLKHGVYHMPHAIGVDESCIWGDYFYLEALVRLTRTWAPYW